jgi:hypothetical protein
MRPEACRRDSSTIVVHTGASFFIDSSVARRQI